MSRVIQNHPNSQFRAGYYSLHKPPFRVSSDEVTLDCPGMRVDRGMKGNILAVYQLRAGLGGETS